MYIGPNLTSKWWYEPLLSSRTKDIDSFGWLNLCQTLSLLNPDPTRPQPDHPGLTYLNWFASYWGFVSELSLIWAWSKLQKRSKQGSWLYPNQYQDAKPQSGTPSVLQSPKSGLKGHGCSLHLQNQDREPKFGSWVYQRPVTIFKSRSRCQTPVRNLQRPPKPQMRT